MRRLLLPTVEGRRALASGAGRAEGGAVASAGQGKRVCKGRLFATRALLLHPLTSLRRGRCASEDRTYRTKSNAKAQLVLDLWLRRRRKIGGQHITRFDSDTFNMTVWPSGLRRWLKAPFRKGVGSNPTAVKELSVSRGKLCENLKVRSGACDGARALQGVLGGTK